MTLDSAVCSPSARAGRAPSRPARLNRRACPTLRSWWYSRHGGVVLPELFADGLHLLAQEVLALLLVGAGFDVVADALADLELGQTLALVARASSRRSVTSSVCSRVDLLLVAQVGGVAARVGERAGFPDAAQEAGDAAVVPAELEQLLNHGAVFALEVACPAVTGTSSGARRPQRTGGRQAACGRRRRRHDAGPAG